MKKCRVPNIGLINLGPRGNVSSGRIDTIWFNLEGSLREYGDVIAARRWLERARVELSPSELETLLGRLTDFASKSDAALRDVLIALSASFDGPENNSRNKALAETLKRLEETLSAKKALALQEAAFEAKQRAAREKLRQEQLQQEEARLKLIRQQRAEEEQKLQEEKLLQAKALSRLQEVAQRDFLTAEIEFRAAGHPLVSEAEFDEIKRNIIRKWLTAQTAAVRGNSIVLDNEQLSAVAAVDRNVQVTARAGSGKTTTLVSRAHFLIDHCGVPPKEVLLLAFNNKAVVEMLSRLLKLLARRRHGPNLLQNTVWQKQHDVHAEAKRLGVELPHVFTFHALALSVVTSNCKSGGSQPPDIIADRDDDPTQSQVVQSVIDDLLRSDAGDLEIRSLMLAHFREDWDEIVRGLYHLPDEEFARLRRLLPRLTLNGEFVKSRGEKLIADFLFEHDVPYKYERSFWANQVNYRPDFTLFLTQKSGAVIEYFGMLGEPGYDENAALKREFWAAQSDWEFIEITPGELKPGIVEGTLQKLHHDLVKAGFICRRLSEDEIWRKVRAKSVGRFAKAMRSFVSRCRKRSIGPRQLKALIDAADETPAVERMFHRAAMKIYSSYLERLHATGQEDFDGIMQQGADAVENGRLQFTRSTGTCDLSRLRFILVDEYQDFSDQFHKLLKAIRTHNKESRVFCVGDDWQAINGFAGSDLRFFQHFERHFGPARRLAITTNYRSGRTIVEAGNAVMRECGGVAGVPSANAPPGRAYIADLAEFIPSDAEQSCYQGDVMTPAVLRLVNRAIGEGHRVVLLGRQNNLPRYVGANGSELELFLEQLKSQLPVGRRKLVSASTVHRFKGLEAPFVIILDAFARSYPLVHPDWVFSRILGDSLGKVLDEERRLFYVAITRAAHTAVLITEKMNESVYIDTIFRDTLCQRLDWEEWPVAPLPNALVILKIGNCPGAGFQPTLRIKDQLKACGYRWTSSNQPGWTKSCTRDGFDIERIKCEPWCVLADNVEVQVLDENNRILDCYRILLGTWTTQPIREDVGSNKR